MKPTFFRLSLLSASLLAGFTYAADTDTAELDTVHVRGEGVSATQRITTKSLDKTTDTDLKEVLFSEPAVSFGGGNGTSQWVTIRGMGQDQIDFKVDDTYSDTQIFHHNGRFLFDPTLIKVIGVQKGTGSASSGIGATSGAIIAETVSASDLLREGQNVGFKVGAGVSSNKGWNRNFAVYGKSGGFDALFSASWVTEKNYKAGKGYSSVTGGTVNNSALGERGMLGKIGYTFNEDHRVVLSHRQEKTYGLRNLREEFDFAQNNNTSNNNPRYRILTHDTTNLAYDGANIGFISKIKANVYRMNQQREEPTESSNPTNKVRTYGANVNLDSRIFDRHTLKYGVNWRNQESTPASYSAASVNEKKTDVGVYVEGIWDFQPVTLTTGVRYDHFDARFSSGSSVSDGNINPSIGLIYDVTPNLALNASHNYATRSPRLSEAALSGARVYSVADGLKAERSRNTEIGFKYNWNQALSFNGSYFWQTIKDVQAVSSSYVYYNGGTLKNHGYELGAAYRWLGLTARAGVAYNKPKMDGASIDSIVTAVPMGRTWTTSLSYQFEHPKLEIGWRGRFVQSSNYDVSSTSTRGGVTTTTTTATKRAGYGVNDIYANWQPTGKDNLNINLAVNNVGNKYYKPHSQRESGSGNSLPEVGRDFRLSVNYRF
ncbi:hemoglobin/transferrin/lactoferrin receptor protein [Neisseria perflava]|uniref:TonB-dependent receptor domain-containing protein n=1 Tax=Neisseria perflava TaxID=33053 RepID=UPI00209D92CA|nr:TonB-dependent receptor [Neisseria perflava]MCP1771408.1 hemoglobin/transferrin/lactoferrin receptor protein [Neisseria perflava]